MNIQDIKQRFGIIGHSPLINRAIEVASQVAPTDMSVLITGESGSGKEVFSQIIHNLSTRKHGNFIAVNCGAIPEGTIDSELFGHEKGSFTGATDARKGYFEVVNGGTIFLDEVGELPLGTQARLLRVLESGEFIRVGSSKVQKTDVRVVAATNVNMMEAIGRNKFREDLYYRLNTVPLRIPPLRERPEDIYLLFRKFSGDFTAKYRIPPVVLLPDAQQLLAQYTWPGNVRQLKNIAEQICILDQERNIAAQSLLPYLPQQAGAGSMLPMSLGTGSADANFSERDILYKVLFDLRKDLNEMKKVMANIIQNPAEIEHAADNYGQWLRTNADDKELLHTFANDEDDAISITKHNNNFNPNNTYAQPKTIEVEETLSLDDREKELIIKALKKYKNKRKPASAELGISERTLYRKIKEYGLDG